MTAAPASPPYELSVVIACFREAGHLRDSVAELCATLLRERPDGFTVGEFRDAAGSSRKHTLPLLGRLDETGVTRRRGDVRIGGPRLPAN